MKNINNKKRYYQLEVDRQDLILLTEAIDEYISTKAPSPCVRCRKHLASLMRRIIDKAQWAELEIGSHL